MTYPDDGEWDVCPECDVKLITNKERDELNRIETAAKTNALYESLKSEYAKKGIQFTEQDFDDYLQMMRIKQLSEYGELSIGNVKGTAEDNIPK